MLQTLNPMFSIWKAGNQICIGTPNANTYIEIRYSQSNEKLIEVLLKDGVTLEQIKNSTLYYSLFEKKMLVEHGKSIKRNQQFYNWLGVDLSNLKLDDSILIFGAGAGGSTLIYLLAQFGFSNLIVFDNDIVEPSEIEKTMVFRSEDIGESKVMALQRIIKINFSVNLKIENKKIDGYDNLLNAIQKYSPKFIVKACDPNLSFRMHLNEICFNNRIPFIYMAYSYNYLVLGPLFIPGITCCDNSNNISYIEKMGKNHDFHLHQKLFSEYSNHPSISFNINTLSSIMLNEIILFLSKNDNYCKTIGKQFYFDLVNFKAEVNVLSCHDQCKFSSKK